MLAIMTTSYVPHEREVDAIAFKSMELCKQSLEPIQKELLKTVKSVELVCFEREILK